MSRRTVVPVLDLIEAIGDPNLFGPWFEPRAHWRTWLVFLKTLFGLPMTPAEVETFNRFTGRTMPPTTAAREAWLVVGRRGGKSRIAALIAVFLACFKSYRHMLAPGERGVVMVLTADREQARVVFGYIEALLDQVPMLRALITHRTKEEIHLRNRITLRVRVRPVTEVEVIEPRWYSCPNRCGAKPVSRPRPDPAVSLASVARSTTRDLSSISRRRSGTAKTSPVWAAVGRHMTQAGGGRIVSLDLGLQNKGSP
jgi:hypothetical protein